MSGIKDLVHTEKTAGSESGHGSLPMPSEPIAWELAADEICSAVEKRASDAFRMATEDIYEGLMRDVQTYLRDNVGFNLSSHLHSLSEALRRAHEQAEAAEGRVRLAAEALRSLAQNADLAAEMCDSEGRAGGFRALASDARSALANVLGEDAGGADGQGPIAAQTADDASGMNNNPTQGPSQ